MYRHAHINMHKIKTRCSSTNTVMPSCQKCQPGSTRKPPPLRQDLQSHLSLHHAADPRGAGLHSTPYKPFLENMRGKSVSAEASLQTV